MKKIIAAAVIAACTGLWGAPCASADNPLDALGGIVTALTSSSKFEIADIAGTWSYQAPAVSFKSENALNKIGGVAASAAIESKLQPYYDRLGINTLTLTVDADANFLMKLKGVTLKGTITKESDQGALTFNFNAFGKIALGKISAQATKSATNVLTLTFDASRAIAVADKVASVAKIETLQTVANLLKSYDGIYAGAKLKKTSNSTDTGAAASSDAKTDPDNGSGNTSKAAEALQNLIKNKKNKQ